MRPLAASIPPIRVANVGKRTRFAWTAAAACLALQVAGGGVQAMTAAKAGFKDSASGAHQRWTRPSVVLTLDPSLDTLGPAAKDDVRSAVGSWIDHVGNLPRPSFDVATEHADAKRDGVSRILAAPITVHGHEHDVAVTIGYADAETGALVEADIIFNTQYAFGEVDERDTPCRNTFDLSSVATHEFGHFFGLGEDMTDKSATMYFKTGRCETNKRALTSSDRDVMTSLYEEPAAAPVAGDRGCAGQ